jgi:hypothetical protein
MSGVNSPFWRGEARNFKQLEPSNKRKTGYKWPKLIENFMESHTKNIFGES